jgi:hypothetical protein
MSRPAQPQDLLLMFDRPTEPIFMPKGDNNNVAFDVPPALLVSRVHLCQYANVVMHSPGMMLCNGENYFASNLITITFIVSCRM